MRAHREWGKHVEADFTQESPSLCWVTKCLLFCCAQLKSVPCRYREMEVGFGKEAQRDDTCDVAYEVFTQGGLYLDSVGVGMVRFSST